MLMMTSCTWVWISMISIELSSVHWSFDILCGITGMDGLDWENLERARFYIWMAAGDPLGRISYAIVATQ